MNTALAGTSLTDARRPSGLAGLAMQAGRTLVRWGELHAARLNDRERLLERMALHQAATEAISERDALISSASFQPLR